MATNRFLTGCALTVALAGCGGVSGIPIDKTATDFAQAICPMAYSCCTMDQLKNNMAAGTTEQECEMKTAANFRGTLQNMQSSENAKRSKYDQTKVDACLAAIRAAQCSELQMIRSLSQIPACDSTFATPLVVVGGKCQNDFECIDSVCQKAAGAVEGVCAAGAAVGQSCVADHCAQDLLCDPRDGSNDSDDVCVAEQDNGGTCIDNFDCKSRNCVADATTGAKTCQAVSGPQCFYGGGCSAAGGRPGVAALCVMGLFALVVMMRARRAARARARRA
ncbi:MAG TPA: hypothetical protein VIF57_10440 [Polyangia bacterium]|jgi:uncharacterized protein (TIGR03382 family)